jgi:hypothetical protein
MATTFYDRVPGLALPSPVVSITAGTFSSVETPTNVLTRATPFGSGFYTGFFAELGSLAVSFENIIGATQAKIKITLDSAGDFPLTPTSIFEDIVLGETTATEGVAVFSGGFSMAGVDTTGSTITTDAAGRVLVYVWIDVDAGSADVNEVLITTLP